MEEGAGHLSVKYLVPHILYHCPSLLHGFCIFPNVLVFRKVQTVDCLPMQVPFRIPLSLIHAPQRFEHSQGVHRIGQVGGRTLLNGLEYILLGYLLRDEIAMVTLCLSFWEGS